MARQTKQAAQASTEIGANNPMTWGSVVSYGYNDRSMFIPSLQGRPLVVEMERMWRQDETVGAMAFAIQTTMGQAVWSHVPCIDGREDTDDNEDAKWAARFCDSLLEDMQGTMADHIEEAISMIPLGFAPCEIVTKQRSGGSDSRFKDNYWGIKKVPLRDQFSIYEWVYEGEDPVAFRQMGTEKSGTVPLWKTLHYRASNYLNNPNGWTFLMNVHRAYSLKRKMQDSEAIGVERDLCGLPTFRLPEEIMNQANEVGSDGKPTVAALNAQQKVRSAIQAVSDMRFNKSGGLIMPSNTYAEDGDGDRTAKWDFKLTTTAGQRSIDVRTAIRDYDRAIARGLMMQFLHLGDRSTGSFALSSDQSDIGIRALMSFANRIAGEWNKKLITLIWAVNRFDPKYMPKLRASELNKDGISQVGKFLADVGRGAELWETDEQARMALARLANLPINPTAQRTAAANAAKRQKREAEQSKQQSLPFGGDNQEGA